MVAAKRFSALLKLWKMASFGATDILTERGDTRPENAQNMFRTTLFDMTHNSWVEAEHAETNGHATRNNACSLSSKLESAFKLHDLPFGVHIFGITKHKTGNDTKCAVNIRHNVSVL